MNIYGLMMNVDGFTSVLAGQGDNYGDGSQILYYDGGSLGGCSLDGFGDFVLEPLSREEVSQLERDFTRSKYESFVTINVDGKRKYLVSSGLDFGSTCYIVDELFLIGTEEVNIRVTSGDASDDADYYEYLSEFYMI